MKWVQLGREVQNCYEKEKKKSCKGQKQSACASRSGVTSCQAALQNGSPLAAVFLGLVW